ncbi:hypothetical protein DM02DRAFT_397347 [Periconia macrospinosa]|uniref:Secreted protein n=1 Tax=Periconia macrospinosa TaxID=97972 RepID=A0A2V1DSY9_9PLEO|nr:hypothetical protein DM02DRAFT_397347 [Periconia macrospinosa]
MAHVPYLTYLLTPTLSACAVLCCAVPDPPLACHLSVTCLILSSQSRCRAVWSVSFLAPQLTSSINQSIKQAINFPRSFSSMP